MILTVRTTERGKRATLHWWHWMLLNSRNYEYFFLLYTFLSPPNILKTYVLLQHTHTHKDIKLMLKVPKGNSYKPSKEIRHCKGPRQGSYSNILVTLHLYLLSGNKDSVVISTGTLGVTGEFADCKRELLRSGKGKLISCEIPQPLAPERSAVWDWASGEEHVQRSKPRRNVLPIDWQPAAQDSRVRGSPHWAPSVEWLSHIHIWW